MKKLILLFCAVAACGAGLTGCNTPPKTRSVEAAGMYANPATESLAIGKVEVVAIPEGEESAIIKYAEDNAWLSPSLKLHEIGVYLTGTNSVASATNIVDSICRAFIAATTVPRRVSPAASPSDPTQAPAQKTQPTAVNLNL